MSPFPLRRRAAALLGALAALLLVAGCGGPGTDEVQQPADGAFPVTIQHSQGTTEIPKRPERVIALGYTDVDPLLALDVIPVAMRPWGPTDGPGSWAKDRLRGAKPYLFATQGDVDLEKVASLQPDLIVAVNAAVDESLYQRLSAVAPTIVRPEGVPDYGTPWQDATRIIGKAVGKSEQAEKLVTDTQARIDQVAAQHPEFAKATGAVVLINPQGGYWPYTRNDARGQFMDGLGIKLPAGVQQLDDGKRFYVDLSPEKTSLLESDVLVVIDQKGNSQGLANDPLFQRLEVTKRGDVIILPHMEAGIELAHNTVLSIPHSLDTIAPMIAEKLADN
ncbi:iron complex transport system substrate-binding protein [Saccharopolyspora antimicrobica]|uniref:Iron complex transport system substrate-binding protein n=1 Tax=Saccharopolyspora antimicrobica TaxID=455193 RepID=A0A1I5H2Y0_9PSEU|nr:iron-siderophore ABC transporter substrate-binding protein [Saccharopolyspora antimicrobica]RKT90113.1 iron complex transport system substrate-binding protein [Saccharopolyspora antimicrobica]SFO42678.1 iron complex transport system substrate-binding protein [Saccharopolyspora antimicrobica]